MLIFRCCGNIKSGIKLLCVEYVSALHCFQCEYLHKFVWWYFLLGIPSHWLQHWLFNDYIYTFLVLVTPPYQYFYHNTLVCHTCMGRYVWPVLKSFHSWREIKMAQWVPRTIILLFVGGVVNLIAADLSRCSYGVSGVYISSLSRTAIFDKSNVSILVNIDILISDFCGQIFCNFPSYGLHYLPVLQGYIVGMHPLIIPQLPLLGCPGDKLVIGIGWRQCHSFWLEWLALIYFLSQGLVQIPLLLRGVPACLIMRGVICGWDCGMTSFL